MSTESLLPLRHCMVAGVEAATSGDMGTPLVLIGGPPTSSVMFREVQRRLVPRATLAPELFTAPAPLGIDAMARRLSEVVEASGAEVVLAHGLAVPVALRATGIQRLILCNGPISQLDPATRVLARLPASVLQVLLQPRILRRWLASSVGLRRAVVNPYVMDRDTVAMLSEAFLADSQRREATAAWLRDLPAALPTAPQRAGRVDAIWGSWDFIYPISQLKNNSISQWITSITPIEGGRWLHPEERPWALADALTGVLGPTEDRQLRPTVTSMS